MNYPQGITVIELFEVTPLILDDILFPLIIIIIILYISLKKLKQFSVLYRH